MGKIRVPRFYHHLTGDAASGTNSFNLCYLDIE
jgi:hypothetical protein